MRPDLVEIIESLRRVIPSGIRVALPGRVARVNSARGRVAVRPELRVAYPARDQGVEYRDLPELLDVPVLWPGTAAVELTVELRAGDPGLLLFADHHLGAWLAFGGLVDPVVPDAHGAGGVVFLPGLHPQDERPALPEAPLRLRLGLRGGARIEVADGEVRALDGGSAVSLAYLSALQSLDDRVTALETAYNAHTHTGVTAGAGISGPPVTPSNTSATVEGTSVLLGE